MPFYKVEEREGKSFKEGIVGRTFWGKEMLMAVVDLAPHHVLPMHSHPHEQVGLVLEGEVTFIIDDEERLLTVGDIYIVPGGVAHEARTGDQPAKVLDVFHPVREDLQY